MKNICKKQLLLSVTLAFCVCTYPAATVKKTDVKTGLNQQVTPELLKNINAENPSETDLHAREFGSQQAAIHHEAVHAKYHMEDSAKAINAACIKLFGLAGLGFGATSAYVALKALNITKYRNTVIATAGLSLMTYMLLKYKDFNMLRGWQKHSLLAQDGSSMCSLSTIPVSIFSGFDTTDISIQPPEMQSSIVAVKAIKAKYDLNDVVMISDLYVSLAHRGNGHAHHLLEETCEHLFSNGTKAVMLIPDPFEYENGRPKSLADDDKKQRLVKLYQSCGFKKNDDGTALFMYRGTTKT
ncbi:MAG: GNAT family N-acetyltransferase [Candidatus Dependentiae bacterium]|nr:GNAT family N-acetyltransferase [Candidatus Dependentiae bacterium]